MNREIILKENTLTYYDWDGVEEFLSNAMGFDKKYFRNYHEVVGGDYKDFDEYCKKLLKSDF